MFSGFLLCVGGSDVFLCVHVCVHVCARVCVNIMVCYGFFLLVFQLDICYVQTEID